MSTAAKKLQEPPLRQFVKMLPGESSSRWRLPVDAGVSVGDPAQATLFGGVGLAAAIEALERSTGRPTIWACAQFLSFAYRGAMLDVEATIPVAGHQITQGQATVRDGDRIILTATASLGAKGAAHNRQWMAAPDVPPPEACGPMPIHWQRAADDMHSRLDVRASRGWDRPDGPDEGRATIWIRPREAVAIDRPFLAMAGDFLPTALGYALGKVKMTSLDNSMRFFPLVPTEWVLCDIRLYAVAAGVGHGRVLMFAQDGTPLATGGQSVIIRSQRLSGEAA